MKTSKWYALDDEYWTTEEVPDRTLCIHEHALPHELCPVSMPLCEPLTSFLCTDTMDLSDISDFEDIMITCPAMRIYQHLKILHTEKTLVCIEHYIDFKLFNLYPLLN